MKEIFSRVRERFFPWTKALFVVLLVILGLSILRTSLFGDVEPEKRIWFDLVFLLLAGVVANLLVNVAKQPSVMILLALGIVISQSAVDLLFPFVKQALSFVGVSIVSESLHFVKNDEIVRVFAQLGAVLLLFKAGLHSEIKEIFNFRNFVVAFIGIIVPFAFGYLYAMAFHPSQFHYAMFLGAALAATSVGVTVAVIQSFGLLQKGFAKIILGAAVLDDILALLLLSTIGNLPKAVSFQEFSPLIYIMLTAIIFIVGGIKLGHIIVNKLFDKYLQEEDLSKTLLAVLAFVFAYAYVSEFIGLSAIVGAFVAGISLNYSKFTSKLFEMFFPLEAFFTPIFFISLGMLINIPAIFGNILPILAITALAILSKLIGCGLAAKVMGSNFKDSLLVGLGMIPRGEIALIIALFGLTSGVLGEVEYSVLASMAFLTTLVTPFALKVAFERMSPLKL